MKFMKRSILILVALSKQSWRREYINPSLRYFSLNVTKPSLIQIPADAIIWESKGQWEGSMVKAFTA